MRKYIVIIFLAFTCFLFTKSVYAVSYSTGRFNQAVTFAGADYINMGNVSDSAKTVSFWAKPNSTTQKFLELNGAAYVEVSGGTVSATGFTSPTIYVDGVAATAIANTNWHHIAVVTGTNINANQVNIGKIGTTYFNGLIDSPRIYNRALSASEIAAQYSLGRNKFDNYSAKIKLAADDSNSYLDESLTNGSDYLLSYWYHLGTDNANPINFTISGLGTIAAEQNLVTDSGNWLKYEIAFEADQTGAHLFKFIQNGATAGNSIVYVDQADLILNKVNKGGMEGTYTDGVAAGWTKYGSGVTPTESATVHTGSKAQQMVVSGGSGSPRIEISAPWNMTAGWYTFSAWIKSSVTSVSAISLNVSNGEGSYNEKYITPLDTANYNRYSTTFYSSGDTTAYYYIVLRTDGTFLIDDVSLVSLGASTAASVATPSSEANSYATGKWGSMGGDAFRMDGGDRLRYSASGVLPNDAGTISIWWKPMWDWDKFDQNVYILNSESASANLIRVLYDYTNHYYTAALYNGANWTTAYTNSAAQTFTEDSWQHIVVSYDNDVGGSAGSVVLYVNGASSGTPYSSANWTAQTVPDYFYAGSLFGSSANTSQADGWLDDIRIYSGQVSSANINAIYGINPNAPTGATWKKNLVEPIIEE